MAMELNISNLLQLFSSLSTILLFFSLLLLSLFNSDVKVFIYLGGILITSIISLIINKSFPKVNTVIPPHCNFINLPFNLNEFYSMAFNSIIISFTLMYFLMPMIFISNINIGVVIFFCILLGIDGITKIMNSCNTWWGVLIGILYGSICGIIWFAIFNNTQNKNLLYFNDEPSNNVVCARPSKQTFKCMVYKNGEVLKEL